MLSASADKMIIISGNKYLSKANRANTQKQRKTTAKDNISENKHSVMEQRLWSTLPYGGSVAEWFGALVL